MSLYQSLPCMIYKKSRFLSTVQFSVGLVEAWHLATQRVTELCRLLIKDMAYKQPNERRDRAGDMATSSFLEHCLEQVSGLPSKTQDALDQIRQMDDKLNNLMTDAQATTTSTIARATAKGSSFENTRRSYQELMHIQRTATETADRKVAIAKDMYDAVETIYADVERRLNEFEALLKKDGRWPGIQGQGGKAPITPRTIPSTKQAQERPAPAKSPRIAPDPQPAEKPAVAAQTPSTRGSQKSRQKDPEKVLSSRVNTGTGRVSTRKASKTNTEEKEDQDMQVEDSDAVMTESVDNGTVDTQLYCVCRNVSHGEMIACEAKNCPYEWYHFECVGLKEAPPQGIPWYCDECKDNVKRKTGTARRKAVV